MTRIFGNVITRFQYWISTSLIIVLAIMGLDGCNSSENQPSSASPPAIATQTSPGSIVEVLFPDLPTARPIGPGIDFYEIEIGGTGIGRPMTLNLYLPKGRHDARSLPCVLIAPAGSGFHGSLIDDSDRAEHYPYVVAGFAVVAYTMNGPVADPKKQIQTYNELIVPVRQFMASRGGLDNGKLAIDYILKKVQVVNPDQLYACGHSSAADIALNLARGDRRIHGCCAYAPWTDVQLWWGNKMERFAPGFTAFAENRSPLRHVNEFHCPVYLFHADDDSMVKVDDNIAFAAAMKAANKQITFDRVMTGEHYNSMIKEGIPRGIKFMKANGATPLPPETK